MQIHVQNPAMKMQLHIILPNYKLDETYKNRLDKIPSFLHLIALLLIVAVLDSTQLEYQAPYTEYYGNNFKHSSEWNNIHRLSLGIKDFLHQGQRNLDEETPNITPEYGSTYDFIVIGAGPAGATVAARLSEIPQVNVLLIEAGTNENLAMDIPLSVYFLQLSNDINWKYQTKPSGKYCLGMNDNSCNWPAGKVMGGTSVLNYMIATRGAAENYDRWAEMGNEGWAYKDILKYFKKLETMNIPELQSDTIYHGTEGPVHISSVEFHTPLAEAFLKAGEELGYSLIDYNGKDTIGFSYLQTTTKNGTRMSSNRAYLHPVNYRRNLRVTRDSMVRKVLIDREKSRAVGVEFVKYGQIIDVFASKEVILCAGAIGSPQLLMLSGIGPAKHLAELGIKVVKDAPVGENLMDHVTFPLTYTVRSPVSLRLSDVLNPAYPYLADFLTKRLGPFTIPGACEGIGFINTKNPAKRSGIPDIELLFSGGELKGDPIIPIILSLNPRMRQIWSKYAGSFGWTIMPILLKPKSRGRIRLLANNVHIKPEIVPNYFDDPEDVRTMIAGIRASLSIGRTEAMQAFCSRLTNETFPGCERFEYDTYAYWDCMIRTMTFTIFHYSGTCKMAPRGDPTAVVDPKLKVIGIQGLRVADASIMPELVSAHTSIPVYMIGEKLADMVKEEWGYNKKSCW